MPIQGISSTLIKWQTSSTDQRQTNYEIICLFYYVSHIISIDLLSIFGDIIPIQHKEHNDFHPSQEV